MVGIEIDADKVLSFWDALSNKASLNEHVLDGLRRIGLKMTAAMQQSINNDLLRVRTGKLKRSIRYQIDVVGDNAELRVGPDLDKAVYGRIQNFGGTIKPKKGKFLTIPLQPNLTGNGVMRVNAREFITNPGSLGFTGSFVNRRKTAIMGVKPGGGVAPVFALKRSVSIRGTGYVKKIFDANVPMVETEIMRAIERHVKESAK